MIIENHGSTRLLINLPSREYITVDGGKAVYIDEKEEFSKLEDFKKFFEKTKEDKDVRIIGDRKTYDIGENIPKKYEEEERIKNIKKNKFENLDI